ncbi:unnamed protein product [Urochloa humidicola]
MAAAGSGSADKENAAPSTSAAAAVAVPRRHGYGVRSCGVKKRPSRARVAGPRVPLRDITNLIAATSAVAGPDSPLGHDASPAAAAELAMPDVAVPAPVVRVAATTQGGAAGGAAAGKKAAAAPRYSLRKGFR